jgi:flagellar biosynthesis GTPase FlhF
LLNSKYVFVVGASGCGKTSFSAKIAATLSQDIKNNFVALGKLGKQNEFLNDNLKSYSRLINIPNVDILPGNAQKKLESIEKKLIIDVSTEVEDTLKIVKKLKEKVGSSKVLTILVIPSGSNKYYLKKLIDCYGSINPVIAFTKLDENYISDDRY